MPLASGDTSSADWSTPEVTCETALAGSVSHTVGAKRYQASPDSTPSAAPATTRIAATSRSGRHWSSVGASERPEPPEPRGPAGPPGPPTGPRSGTLGCPGALC